MSTADTDSSDSVAEPGAFKVGFDVSSMEQGIAKEYVVSGILSGPSAGLTLCHERAQMGSSGLRSSGTKPRSE